MKNARLRNVGSIGGWDTECPRDIPQKHGSHLENKNIAWNANTEAEDVVGQHLSEIYQMMW